MATPLAERRAARRQRCLVGAQIIFSDGKCAISGQILNFSDTGAMVRPADIVQCPDEFALKPRYEAPRACQVTWRKAEMLGVRYL